MSYTEKTLNIERFSSSRILREIRVIRVQIIYALWVQKTVKAEIKTVPIA